MDEFVVFEALKLNEIREIVRLQAKRVEARLAEKKIKLQLDESAVDYLAVRTSCCTGVQSPDMMIPPLLIYSMTCPGLPWVHSRVECCFL